MSRPRPLLAPASPPRRYTAGGLPSYRHLPGFTPHPVRDPRGHAFGVEETPASLGCSDLPDAWRECREYLLGVDLFNRAFFWEAHEAWEAAWHAAGCESRPGLFLQGLIQSSAALLKRHLGVPRGARSLAAKASSRLDRALTGLDPSSGGEQIYMGVDVAGWRAAFAAYLVDAERRFPYLELRWEQPRIGLLAALHRWSRGLAGGVLIW